MNDKARYLFAGVLIFVIILLQPIYLKWLGYDAVKPAVIAPKEDVPSNSLLENISPTYDDNVNFKFNDDLSESLITVITPLYTATLSNRSGGTINNYVLTEKEINKYRHHGGFDDDGAYFQDIPVSLTLPNDNYCQPCLGFHNDDEYSLVNGSFKLITRTGSDTIFIDHDEVKTLDYVLYDDKGIEIIKKSVTFSSNNYVSQHDIVVNERGLDYNTNLELLWLGGLRPTEEKINEDIQYSSGMVSQAGEIENITVSDPKKIVERTPYNGTTEWVAIRSKYFVAALLSKTASTFATLSAKNINFGKRDQTPAYSASLGYPLDQSSITAEIYLGPLDVDYIIKTGSTLDSSMNWGWAIIRPISKGILWVLKFMHNAIHLNYGFVLLLFALLIRLITGPLTKKSYESTQKMQKIQPEIKKLQEKLKKDPQRLNREMMGLYKKHGVNPLGGCLPMLLQMPLLMALFVVFRTTIEFRGQAFLLWITDLSKPDVVFTLPFNIPVYGDGVAILPLLMGATLFLTMKMSSATMDKSQKPIMYFMNGFFILLFNGFPSGLNLYYTTYNIMSFFQQRGIRKRLSS